MQRTLSHLQHDPELCAHIVHCVRRQRRLLQRVGGTKRPHQRYALLRNGAVPVLMPFALGVLKLCARLTNRHFSGTLPHPTWILAHTAPHLIIMVAEGTSIRYRGPTTQQKLSWGNCSSRSGSTTIPGRSFWSFPRKSRRQLSNAKLISYQY